MSVVLKIFRVIFSTIGLILAGYGLVTRNFEFMPFLMFSLGVVMLVGGLIELQRKPKSSLGYINIIASSYAFFVSVQGFLLN